MPLFNRETDSRLSALVCTLDTSIGEDIIKGLEDLGISVTRGQYMEDALDKMRFNLYDIIIEEEGFGGPVEEDRLLTEIKGLTQSQRRKSFVALIGDRWNTGDELTAFALSVNLLINKENLKKVKDILEPSIIQYKKLYKVFDEVKTALGLT